MTLLATLLTPVMLSPGSPLPQRSTSNQKVIKDPAEYAAYVNAVNIKDSVKRGAAMEEFARNYPDSIVKIDALEQAMSAYQRADNYNKVEEIAKRILVQWPASVRALAVVTSLERTKAAHGDSAALRESCTDAQKGLQVLQSWQKPEATTDAEFEKMRTHVSQIFNSAAGYCALQAKNYTAARDYYLKSVTMDPERALDVYQLGMAEVEMNPIDPTGFWYLAKSMNLAQAEGSLAFRQEIEMYAKGKYRDYHGNEAGWDAIVSESANQSAPPADFPPKTTDNKTPCELAVSAAKGGECCSIEDAEIVLKQKDCSAANKDAADKVWQALQSQQKGGKKLKISIKVISATKDTIHAAVSEENQKSNTTDLQVVMAKPMSQVPAAGSRIDVMGVIQSYMPDPFMFLVMQGELPGTAHAQLSEADIEKLLQGGVTPKRATELVKQKGVNFALDDGTEARLRQAGATDELLLAIATAKK